MRWGLAEVFVAAAVAVIGLDACASDCDVACGKLEFCQQLPDISRQVCSERCGKVHDENADLARNCGDCLHGASCKTISKGGCSLDCERVLGVPIGNPGTGGAGGDGVGVGGTGGAVP
ncbi:hypothetical protein [Vulgatibacter incomptus]|uniref:Uncharacterized protein n=1 Tax=Vulgatibacter incomptus TaxID=1391653 RepID=A0A0K1PFN4_9BACT|nr:hypothetical protein [Vulgatibacter incomptus]AKU92317.1 hypothetical protein AKJ08_2704 [Vulgatibacter incomptus]